MLKAILITSVSHTLSSKNLNSYQRIYFLSRYTELTILVKKNCDLSGACHEGTRIITSPVSGKLGLIVYVIFWAILNGRRAEVDFVITEPSILGLCGFLLKHIYRPKWIVDVWDIPIRCHSDSSLTKLRCSITRRIFKYLYRYTDLFIVSILPDFELKWFKIPNEKMLLLNNAIWFDVLPNEISNTSKTNTFNILCMRSIYTKDMGLDILSYTFVQLKSRIPNISLTIVGEIPKQVEQQVEILKKHREVRFTGIIVFKELERLIGRADICVVPFRNVPDLAQTYPTKILQYLSIGKPVIASRIAGIQTMIKDGYNGILFNPGDVEDFARKIELLYSNNNLRQKISKNAGNLESKYDCRVKNQIILNRVSLLTGKKR